MASQWYPVYFGDYIRDTADLPLIQHGAYWLLLGHFYTTRTPIPADARYRVAHAHTDEERAAVDVVLSRFWIMTKAGYIQKRAALEIQKALRLEERGRQAAETRWGKGGNANASARQMQEELLAACLEDASTSTSTSTSKTTPTTQEQDGSGKAAARAADPIWDTLLEVCGVKAGDKITSSARGAYNKSVKDLKAVAATPEEIRRRARAFAVRWGDKITPTALVRRWNECTANTSAPATKTPKQIADEKLAEDVKRTGVEQRNWKLRPQMKGEAPENFVERIRRESADAFQETTRKDKS